MEHIVYEVESLLTVSEWWWLSMDSFDYFGPHTTSFDNCDRSSGPSQKTLLRWWFRFSYPVG